jgi:hypothetical protein
MDRPRDGNLITGGSTSGIDGVTHDRRDLAVAHRID